MSEFTIEAKKEAREAVQKMYEAIQPVCGTGPMSDAMESVDLAALAIYDAYDITFVRCSKCDEDELVELAVNNLCESCAGEVEDRRKSHAKSWM